MLISGIHVYDTYHGDVLGSVMQREGKCAVTVKEGSQRKPQVRLENKTQVAAGVKYSKARLLY